jgi:hypothetical protein
MAKPKRLRGVEERLERTKNSLDQVADDIREKTRALSGQLKRAAELEMIKAQIEEEIRNKR